MGFTLWGKKNEELVYVRDFGKKINKYNLKHTYPFISRSSNTYIVPIYEEYHTELLPDSILLNLLRDFVEDFPQKCYKQKDMFLHYCHTTKRR
jgi:hypothetical protein